MADSSAGHERLNRCLVSPPGCNVSIDVERDIFPILSAAMNRPVLRLLFFGATANGVVRLERHLQLLDPIGVFGDYISSPVRPVERVLGGVHRHSIDNKHGPDRACGLCAVKHQEHR
jgi:hypothetical protein